MSRFNARGMWRLHDKLLHHKGKQEEDILIVKQCFCLNGHNLVSPRVQFKGYNGIMIKVRREKETGFLALSPICGDKSKLTLDISLQEGELLNLSCPVCNIPLPVYAPCDCGGDILTLFADKNGAFCNCIGICNRVGCSHSEIKHPDELFAFFRKKGEIRGSYNFS